MRKLFKKSIACCLALALCFTLFAGAISVNALTETPTFSTEAVEVVQGENAVIKFTVENFAEIQGVMLKFYVPAVVSEIVSVASEGFEMVEWDDENGVGNYEIGADATGKFVKFMELANFTGVDTVEGFTFDITVAVPAEATLGAAEYPVAYIVGTDGEAVYDFECNYADFTVVAPVVADPAFNFTGMAYDLATNKIAVNYGAMSQDLRDLFADAKGPNNANAGTRSVKLIVKVGAAEFPFAASAGTTGGTVYASGFALSHMSSEVELFFRVTNPAIDFAWDSNSYKVVIADYLTERYESGTDTSAKLAAWIDLYEQYKAADENIAITNFELAEGAANFNSVSYNTTESKVTVGYPAITQAWKDAMGAGKGPDNANASTRVVQLIVKIGETEFPFAASIGTTGGSIYASGFSISHFTTDVQMFVRVTNEAIDYAWDSNAVTVNIDSALATAEGSAFADAYNAYKAAN